MSFLDDVELAYMISHGYFSSRVYELPLKSAFKTLTLPKTRSDFQQNMKRVICIHIDVDQLFVDLVSLGQLNTNSRMLFPPNQVAMMFRLLKSMLPHLTTKHQ